VGALSIRLSRRAHHRRQLSQLAPPRTHTHPLAGFPSPPSPLRRRRHSSAVVAHAPPPLASPRVSPFRVFALLWQVTQLEALDSIQSIIETLQNVQLLQCLEEDQFNKLIDSFEMVNYLPTDRIIRQGELGNSFYIILKGTVNCIQSDDSVVATLNRCEYFGEVYLASQWLVTPRCSSLLACSRVERRSSPSLLTGRAFEHSCGQRALLKDEPRAAHVDAVTNVTLAKITRDTFMDILGPLEKLMEHQFTRKVLHSPISSHLLPSPPISSHLLPSPPISSHLPPPLSLSPPPLHQVLQRVPILSHLSASQRETILDKFVDQHFEPREPIITQVRDPTCDPNLARAAHPRRCCAHVPCPLLRSSRARTATSSTLSRRGRSSAASTAR
jgi:CRP-like cAMP-binding protein